MAARIGGRALERQGARLAPDDVGLRARGARDCGAAIHTAWSWLKSSKLHVIRRPTSCRCAKWRGRGRRGFGTSCKSSAAPRMHAPVSKTVLATVGAKLPGGHAIAAAKLRGVESFGMLSSAKELGPGGNLGRHPRIAGRCTRGHRPARLPAARRRNARTQRDAESRRRNVGARYRAGSGARWRAGGASAGAATVAPTFKDTFAVKLSAPAGCPKFTCRIVRGIDNKAASPPGCASDCGAPASDRSAP